MYYQKFINFLKTHNLYYEEVFNYWTNNRSIFDYRDEDKRDFIGCYTKYKNEYLTEIKLIVPWIDNDKTVLINIHEYIHLLLLYYNIGKKYFPGDDKETLPIFYEKVYIEENNSKELSEYYQYVNSFITDSNRKEYVLALELSDAISDNYQKDDNIFKLDKCAKKLVKKYERNKQS